MRRIVEWTLKLLLEENDLVTGRLLIGDRGVSLASGSLSSFYQEFKDDLKRLDSLRNASRIGEPQPEIKDLRPSVQRIGRGLAEYFLSSTASDRLARMPRDEVCLVLQAPPEIQRLPWELMVLFRDTEPLAAQPDVQFVRRLREAPEQEHLSPPPPPLRIAFAAASPDEIAEIPPRQRLNYEGELAKIAGAVRGDNEDAVRLTSLEPVPLEERPVIFDTVLGSPALIGDCVRRCRTQILHLTGHGRGGRLILEDDKGQAIELTADEMVKEAGLAGTDLRLAYLGQCETARLTADADTLRAATAQLSHHVPIVVGMQWAIGVIAASMFEGALYQDLARSPNEPVEAFCNARRKLYEACSNTSLSRRTTGAEWATPVLYLASSRVPALTDSDRASYFPRSGVWSEETEWEAILPDLGDFIGRRGELRGLLATLRTCEEGIVALHGTAGMGKSTLAAHACSVLSDFHVGVLFGVVTPGRLWSLLADVTRRILDDDVKVKSRAELETKLVELELPATASGSGWRSPHCTTFNAALA